MKIIFFLCIFAWKKFEKKKKKKNADQVKIRKAFVSMKITQRLKKKSKDGPETQKMNVKGKCKQFVKKAKSIQINYFKD